jgi:hypothetical protein
VGFRLLPAVVSLVAVKVGPDLTSDDGDGATVDLEESRGASEDVAGGWVNEGLRRGTSPGGRGVEASFEVEVRGLWAAAETCEPMLRAGTSVSGTA